MCKIRCPFVQFLTEIVRQASLCDIALVPLESISFQKFESVNQLIQQPLNYSEVRHSYSSCSETLRGIRALLLSRIGLRLFFQQLSRRVRVRPTLHFKRSEWQVECKLGQLLIPQNICERREMLQLARLVGEFYLRAESHDAQLALPHEINIIDRPGIFDSRFVWMRVQIYISFLKMQFSPWFTQTWSKKSQA